MSAPTTKNRPFQSAYRHGLYACEAGASRHTCPYRGVHGRSGNVPFSRAFRAYWLNGWDDAADLATATFGESSR